MSESENSTTTTIMGDLSSSRPHHRKLPAELNREIFLCFNPATQRKFICGLGWDFYAMFRHRLLIKTKRVCNPDRNFWNKTTTEAIVSNNGLHAEYSNTRGRKNIYAEKGFAITGNHCRKDGFPGTICYYFEVMLSSSSFCRIGLSNCTLAEGELIGVYPNSYAISTISELLNWRILAGRTPILELPADEAISLEPKENEANVYGCGLVMDPNDKLAIFFTLNGILMSRQIPISPSAEELFPAISLFDMAYSIEANFGNDKDKPFEYDIKNCPGMGLDCI